MSDPAPHAEVAELAAHAFAVHQEEDLLPTRALGAIAAVGTLIGAVAVIIAWVLVTATGGLRSRASLPAPAPVPRTISGIEQSAFNGPGVGLSLWARQRRELESWGWADRAAGIARIPIDKAIDVEVEEASR